MKTKCFLAVAALLLVAQTNDAQVTAVAAGAEAKTVGAKLVFTNAATVDVASGFAHPLVYTIVTNLTLTNGFYSSTNLQFVASSTVTNDNSAATGSFLVGEFVSVSGPEGSTLSFWEQGSRIPTFMFPIGTTPAAGTRFDVSAIERGAGLPDGDPYGVIPGRRFTVNKAGEYTVGVKLYDTSENHPTQEAPIHAPSEVLTVKFTTTLDINVATLAVTNNIATLMIKQGGLTNLFVDFKPSLGPGQWTTVAGPFQTVTYGTNLTAVKITNDTAIAESYFRVRTPSLP